MYYERDISYVLKQASKEFRVVVLTGSRQTGKSTLLAHDFSKTHRIVSLDNPQDLKLALSDPSLFFSIHKPPLIIDEIQYAPELLPVIKQMVDQSSKKGQIILTGSQQFTLMKNLRETLAGRVGLFHLLPMSIGEGPVQKRGYASRALQGSYPELLVSKTMDAHRWFGSYVATYLEKDVQSYFKIERAAHFRDFLFLIATRVAQELNMNSLSNDLGVSVPTIKSWIKVLQASSIVYLLRPYYVNLGSRIVKAPKIFFYDIGLVSYLTGVRQEEALWQGPMAGPLYENFVVQEILKRFENVGVMAPIYYYRTNNGLEVDLLIERKEKSLIPVEIKLNRTPHPGMARGIERLRNLNPSKAILRNGYVIAPLSAARQLTRTETALSLENFLQEEGEWGQI